MDTLQKLICAILGISFMTFVTFFGRLPALRNTPIAGLYKLIWVHFPNVVNSLDQRFTSGRATRSLSWLWNRVLHERHPTIVIFFLSIMSVGEYFYLPDVWPQIGWFTKITAAITIVLPYVFLYLSCSADPGYITPENHEYYMSLYPYDYGLFHPGNECRTCRLLKPARSKHCDICKRCIARADHHCVFINSCVGYGNHHWFLLLLVSTGVLCVYGGALGMSILTVKMKARYPIWSLWPPRGMSMEKYLLVWGWGLHGNIRMGATTLLAVLISPLVWGLTLYSIFLVYCGTTTNESMKWSDFKDDMNDGFAYRRRLPLNRRRDFTLEPPCSRWPEEPEHIMVPTNDGRPPRSEARLGGEGEWERVWNLKAVNNLYDQGFMHNLGDIFFSDYHFGHDRLEPRVERRWRENKGPASGEHPP